MSETQIDEPQPSDFARALNSMMDNVENAVVKFQKALLMVLEKIDKLEDLEKLCRSGALPNERGYYTEEIKQPTNDTAIPAKMPHQESSLRHNEAEMTANTETNLPQSKNEIPELGSATGSTDVKESSIPKRSIQIGIFSKILKKVSSKSNYLVLAIALAIVSIAVVKIYFMLFP
ncbi:MAG: hypothetical protein OEW95_05625 [Candidatus Bathyarchaeota archaeon]|nr:hypothetical protein [Candidatus Bathyarchaeota archaeon]